MADIYKPVTNYIDTGIQQSGQSVGGQGSEVDEYLNSLPPEEREAAVKRLTAPASTAEIAKSALASGRPPTMDEFRAIREYNKTKEVDVLEAIGSGFSGVMTDLSNAMGSAWDDPVHALKTAPANVIEGFGQGTRNFYGMLAQSADPSSKLFRLKSVLGGTDSDAEQYRQYMDAWNFNKHSEDIISGKTTVIMDKDMIDPHITQAMSYVLDPTLFIPFGEVASGGIKAIGMGEKLAEIAARTSAIKAGVLGGTLKWGVGAPIEFMGTAVRNTIDYGIERGAAGFEAISGVPAKEFQTTARLSGWGTAAASVGGYHIPYASTISEFMVGSRAAQGIGEAISAIGDQIIKQKGNRGILSYAGQALADTEKVGGIQLSSHAKSLLKIADAVDPLFGFANEITKGAAHGAMIGAGLGYASGGEEGMAHGIGAGMALGAVGGGFGKVVNEATNIGLYDRTAIQRKMVIEGLKQVGGNMDKAMAFEAMVKTAEATGNRHYMAEVDGIIAAFDKIAPNAKLIVRDNASHEQFLKDNRIDPATGRLIEKSQILPDVTSRSMTADALAVLRDNGDMFMGNSKQFLDTINTDKKYARQKKAFEALDPTAQKAVLGRIDDHADSSFRSSLKGMSIKDYYGHLNYAERLADTVNKIAINTSEEAGRAKINEFLKSETVKGQLTRRGKMLKDKLAADGWFDKDGKMLARRDTQGETPLEKFKGSAGFVFRRDATGQVEIHLNTSALGDTTIPHELFHAVMMDSVLKPDFMDRWVQKLIGKYDDKGNMLEAGSAHISEVKKFFEKYIESENRNDPETIRIKKEELRKSLEEYQSRGKNERISDKTVVPLEHYAEEFGAYYFQKWLRGKPVDYLFRGGDLGGIRGLLESAKGSWLDFWQSKIQQQNPSFDFNNIKDYKISQAFEKDGKRVRISAFDLFMQDFVRANSNLNKESGFDLSRLSQEAQAQFINANGIRGYGKTDATGRVIRYNQRKAIAEEVRVGKEIYKILNSLDPALRKGGTTTDGEGNISGRPNTAEIDAIVKSGLVSRAWCDKVMRGFDIVEGNGGNVIYFGYLGRTAQIGDYAWPRLVGSDVPFKNRAAILFGVDFKVGADGKMHSLFHTLDKQVIEARGNNLWKDANIRDLWDGDRASMEADFFKYLSNASKPSSDTSRRPSHLLLDRGDGLGAQRRNALHQMLGMAKGENEVYINKPTSEIPYGIRQSVTTFNVDGISNLRVDNGVRYDYKDVNAGKDLSRNFMPSEMKSEDTPSGGKLIKHATGYNISKQAGEKFKVFSPEGKMLGAFDTIADAGRAAQKHFNESYDKSVEGKDKPVPPTEIPPSRQAYIEREFEKSSATYNNTFVGGKDNYVNNVKVLLDRFINGREDVGVGDGYIERAKKLKASIEKNGNIKLSELEELSKLGAGIMHDTSRLPYYNYDFFWQATGDLLSEHLKKAGERYDAMYPMEIKSALHPRLAQIFQDYPNITAQGLLKKLVTYGSQGSRMFQEATEIGLVDLLKSKIQKTTTPRFLPDGRMIEMTQGVTQPKLNMVEILDFAKSKEIKVTIEEGARELSGMDTSRYTLGGAKNNYKQTAIRINPEYAHGIRGHYGENTIVHFRTTERIDADGNRHLYIEEVQANNTDAKKASLAQREIARIPEFEKGRDALKAIIEEGKKTGRITDLDENGMTTKERIESGQPQEEASMLHSSYENWLKSIEVVTSEEYLNQTLEARRVILKGGGLADIASALDYHLGNEIVIATKLAEKNHYNELRDFKHDIYERVLKVLEFGVSEEHDVLKDIALDVINNYDINKLIENSFKEAEEQRKWRHKLEKSGLENSYSVSAYARSPWKYQEMITDVETRIQQAKSIKQEKSYPLTSSKDWTLTALKGIIRQAIRDGLDKITLTHPDDSPTVSHMKGDARKGLYGKLIPEVWSSWLRKYGIEMKQTNKLADATIDTAKAQMAEITNKLHDANKAVLDHFEQVKNGEDPATVNKLAELMAMPVHESDEFVGVKIQNEAKNINDNKLRTLIGEVAMIKSAEKDAYNRINKLRENGIRGESDSRSTTDSGISAEAIDRGMTFELNDRIKRDFLDGKIQTHAMPAEGGADSVATRNKITLDANGVLSKLGMNLKDKTKMEIWMRHLTDDPATALETIKEEGLVGWMKNRAQSIIDAEVESFDPAYKELKHQQKVAQQFLEKIESGKIDAKNFMPAEGQEQGGRTYDQNSRQWKAGFLGLYAEQNPERVKGLNLQFMKRADGSYRIRLTDNSKKGESADVGHITANIEGDRATLSAHINEDYRGKKLAYVVYSEMAERLRAMGVTAVDGQIVNPDGIPIKVREAIIGDTRDMYSGRRINYVEAANRIQDKQALVGSMGGVDVTNTLFKQARYMPAEGNDINRIVKNNLDDILRSKGTYATHNIEGLIEQYIHRFKNVDVSDVVRYVELKEEHNLLDKRLGESEDYYNGLSDEDLKNVPDDAPSLPEDIRDEMNPIMEEMNDIENRSIDALENDKNTSFSDIVNLIEQAKDVQKQAVKLKESTNTGLKEWESFKRRFLKSENAEVFQGVEQVFRDNERSKLPKLFVSELYSGHFASGEQKGLIVDILKREGKIKKDGLTYGSRVNPQRLINLLRNEAGSGNKAYTEAQAIGFIDWLKLRMGGVDKDTAGGLNLAQPQWALKSIEDANQHRESLNLKGKQNTIPTSEVIDWLDKNQLDIRIDKKPVPNVNSETYVAGGEIEGYRDLVIRMPERYSHGVEGHFGNEKTNVVAHVRVTFRIDAEGNKVMHIEEIQANNANVDVLPPKERETYKQVLKELATAQLNYEKNSVSDAGFFGLRNKAISELDKRFQLEGRERKYTGIEDARKALDAEKNRIIREFENKDNWATLNFKKFEKFVNLKFQKDNPEITAYLRHIYDRQMAEAKWRLEAKKALEKTKLWNNEAEQLNDVDPKTGIKYPVMTEISRLRSEIQSAAEKEGNKAPLQDPKEWIKLAFRTILREATVEGVDRVTLTPYDKTPMQVGMNKNSAKSLYGKIIPQYFESELAKINQKLNVKNKNNNLIEKQFSEDYIDLKDLTQKRIKEVSDKWDTSQPTHENAGEVFRFLHSEDSTLISNHASINGEFNRIKFDKFKDKISDLAEGMPSGNNRNLVIRAVNAKFQQMNHYTNWKFSEASMMDRFGESASLVDRSIGFDMTDKTKELGKQSRPNFQPAEGWRDWKSERTSVGSVIRNAIGYVIMVQNDKFKVYSPAKALIGIYGNEDQAKRRVQKDEPKQ